MLLMTKSMLILMLITTQLLSWSGASLYLCIDSDGSYCIHAGPDSCTSCQVTGAGQNACSDANLGQRGGSLCGKHGEDRLIQHSVAVVEPVESCDCTHIPIMLASDQRTRAARESIALDFARLSSVVAQAPAVGLVCLSVFQSGFHCCDASAVPDFTLTVISTVIIRC